MRKSILKLYSSEGFIGSKVKIIEMEIVIEIGI